MPVPLLSIPIFILFAAAVFFAVVSLWPSGEQDEVAARLGLAGVESEQISPLVAGLRPVFGLLVPTVKWVQAPRYRAWIERQMVTAGMTGVMTVNEYFAYKLLMGGVFWLLFVLLFARIIVGWDEPVWADIGVVLLGTFFPDSWLTGQVRERQDRIRRNLPYVLDLLTLSVEAGLDFVAGIHKVCEKSKQGPLIDELSFFLSELQVGATRQQALRNLASRVDMPELRSFCAMLIQADVLGASVGPVLRAQSDLLRTQRFQRAERMGAYASQKILFPLILCIMPAVFIIIFGPIVLNFIYGDQTIGL
jgi:tight adherence protein C